jgi:site-specific DNA recombinase
MAAVHIGRQGRKVPTERRSALIRQGMARAAREGRIPGSARTGYLAPDFLGVSGVDPARGPDVRRMLLRLLAGKSLRAVQRTAFQEGLVSGGGGMISLATVHRMAGDPFYAGYVRYDGRDCPGMHEGLLSVEEFNALQETLGRPENAIRPQK